MVRSPVMLLSTLVRGSGRWQLPPTRSCSSLFRPFSTFPPSPTASTSSVPSPAIYVSDSTDPFFNLAFEDWIFRKTDPNQIVLYMYRNKPSVIIGRNQNPWKEIDLDRLKELSIPFVRRKSGGGTVYHDLGNTNYCIYVPRLSFERDTNAQLVARALNQLGIKAFVNSRHDICVEDAKILHVSGSAYKLVNARAYHHGTMLIDARLEHLRGVLSNTKDGLTTKGVASVSSNVGNLSDYNDDVSHETFVDAVVKEFKSHYGGDGIVQKIDEKELETNEYASSVVSELKSWDWMYGQTPEFTHEISLFSRGLTFTIRSRHALITSISVTPSPGVEWLPTWSELEQAEELGKRMEGDRYGSLEGTEQSVSGLDEEDGVRRLVRDLKGSM